MVEWERNPKLEIRNTKLEIRNSKHETNPKPEIQMSKQSVIGKDHPGNNFIRKLLSLWERAG